METPDKSSDTYGIRAPLASGTRLLMSSREIELRVQDDELRRRRATKRRAARRSATTLQLDGDDDGRSPHVLFEFDNNMVLITC